MVFYSTVGRIQIAIVDVFSPQIELIIYGCRLCYINTFGQSVELQKAYVVISHPFSKRKKKPTKFHITII